MAAPVRMAAGHDSAGIVLSVSRSGEYGPHWRDCAGSDASCDRRRNAVLTASKIARRDSAGNGEYYHAVDRVGFDDRNDGILCGIDAALTFLSNGRLIRFVKRSRRPVVNEFGQPTSFDWPAGEHLPPSAHRFFAYLACVRRGLVRHSQTWRSAH